MNPEAETQPRSRQPGSGQPGSGHLPAARIVGVLLAPGAAADASHSGLVAIDRELRALDLRVRRIDFPYRIAGRRAPDRPEVLLETVVSAARSLAEELGTTTEHLALGGRSMGGRVCSLAVAQGLRAGALVLVSYPLHPPGKPERRRTEHFPQIRVPCLFVSGTKDAFATPAELTEATQAINAPVTQVWLEGGDHGLRRRDTQAAEAVASWLQEPRGRSETRRQAASTR